MKTAIINNWNQVAIAAIVLAASACSELDPAAGLNDGRIHARVSPYALMTKSSSVIEEPSGVIDLGDGISLVQYVSEMDNGLCECATKGTVVSTSNIPSVYGDMMIHGYLGSKSIRKEAASHFLDGNMLKYDASSSEWDWYDPSASQYLTGEDIPVWRNNVDTYMWCIAPYAAPSFVLDDVNKDDASDSELSKLSFHYVNSSDVLAQKDLLVSFNKENRAYNTDGTSRDGKPSSFNVKLNHALAAMQFEVSAAGLANDIEITRLEVRGLHSSADCIATGSAGGVNFAWTADDDADNVVVSKDISKSSLSADNRIIFIVPQSNSAVKLYIKFVKHGIPVTREINLNSFGSYNLEAGKLYKYKISASVHVPGEQIPIEKSFSYKGFKNGGGYQYFDNNEQGFNVVGVTKIGISVTQGYRDTAGKSDGYFFLQSMDGTKTTEYDGSYQYDFWPVPPVPAYPYDGGDGVTESYAGVVHLTATSGTSYYVFDVTGFKYFKAVCRATGDANNAVWSGEFFKYYILEVEDNTPETSL